MQQVITSRSGGKQNSTNMSFFGNENIHKFGAKSQRDIVDHVEDDWGLYACEAQEQGTATSSFNSIHRLPEENSAQEDKEFGTLNLGSKHGSGRCNKSKFEIVFYFLNFVLKCYIWYFRK
jgi:hypothetical protein